MKKLPPETFTQQQMGYAGAQPYANQGAYQAPQPGYYQQPYVQPGQNPYAQGTPQQPYGQSYGQPYEQPYAQGAPQQPFAQQQDAQSQPLKRAAAAPRLHAEQPVTASWGRGTHQTKRVKSPAHSCGPLDGMGVASRGHPACWGFLLRTAPPIPKAPRARRRPRTPSSPNSQDLRATRSRAARNDVNARRILLVEIVERLRVATEEFHARDHGVGVVFLFLLLEMNQSRNFIVRQSFASMAAS